MPSSASCRDAHAVMPRPRGIQERTASDAVVLGQISPITSAGDHIARWAKRLRAARRALSIGQQAERSSRNLCSAGYTTFTALLHDKFSAPLVNNDAPNRRTTITDCPVYALIFDSSRFAPPQI